LKVENIDLTFTYEGRYITASGQIMHIPGVKYPQYRIVIPKKKDRSDVFIFYDIESKQEFFWYPLPDHREAISSAIARQLFKMKYKTP
jgi:hypothetical protein